MSEVINGTIATKGNIKGNVNVVYGKDGVDGKSAYQIALDNGFEGTEAEWIESLKGEAGKSGVYVGSGDMPEGFNVKVDLNGKAITIEGIANEVLENLQTPIYLVGSCVELKQAINDGYKSIVLKNDFEVGEQITLSDDLILDGCGHTITRSTGYEDLLIRMGERNVLRNITVDGNREAMITPYWDRTSELYVNHKCIVENVTLINGNEAIAIHGDDAIISNCKITNCGGNGLHFTGGSRIKVENCVIVGTNKLGTTMGNEGGCIKWCRECPDVTVINCWLEDGLSGFGDITGADDAGIQLIGNTVKNCTDVASICVYLGLPKNIIVNSNRFVDSGRFVIKNTSASDTNVLPLNIICSNNTFQNCTIEMYRSADIIISSNIMEGNSYIYGQQVSNITIADNIINHTGVEKDYAVMFLNGYDIKVKNNYIRSKGRIIVFNNSNYNVSVIGNTLRHNYANDTASSSAITFQCVNGLFKDNDVFTYKYGMGVGNYETIDNNLFYMANTNKGPWEVPDTRDNLLITNNRTNGYMRELTTSATRVIQNNAIPLNADNIKTLTATLTNITADIPSKVMIGDEFECVLVAGEGYSLPETVTIKNNGNSSQLGMGHDYNQETGKLVIYKVFGDVTITATAV